MAIKRKSWESTEPREFFWGNGSPDITWQSGTVPIATGGHIDYEEPFEIENHRQKIRDGIDCTTTMMGNTVVYESHQVDFRLKKTATNGSTHLWGQRGDIGVVLGVPSDPSSLSLTYADNIARERVCAKAIAVQRKFQAGVAMGELAETIRMIRNPLGAIFEDTLQYCDRVRKRARIYKRLKDRRRMLTDSWLQYSFGVAPLFSDIHNAAEAAAQIITYRLPRETVRGRSDADAALSFTSHNGNISAQGPLHLEYCWNEETRAEVRYTAQVRVSNDTTADDLASLGLTWGNFFPTVWEVIPYSFLVDYFTNCGKVIDTLAFNDARLNWCFRGYKLTSESVLSKCEAHIDPNSNPEGFEWTAYSGGHGARLTHSVWKREGGMGLPTPSLRFKLPFSSPVKVANMAALALSAKKASNALRI